MTRARDFLAVVGNMAALPCGTVGNAREISVVADEVGCGGQCLGNGRRRQLGRAWPQSDDGQRARHSRRPWPGMSTMAKYGPGFSAQSLSGMMRSSLMVPRST